MKTGSILIIGGYGHVGRTIATVLAEYFPGQVIAAGRDIRKAEALSQVTGGKVRPQALDLFDPNLKVEKLLDGVAQVIMCLDQPDTCFVERVIQKGVDYIDITASSDFLEAMAGLDGAARTAGTCAVLSVGLVPGLTNLMAAQTVAALDEVQHMDIFVLLGMGDDHGDAAVQWTLRNLHSEFTVLEDGEEVRVRSFEDGVPTLFPGIGERTAYRIDFPDQHVLPKTLGINSVSSRLAFDLEILTKGIAALKKAGLLGFLRHPRGRQIATRMLKTLRFGSDQFILKLETTGTRNGHEFQTNSIVRGADEAHKTGLVAAQVARRLYSGEFPAGVFHIEQRFHPDEFISSIQGIMYESGNPTVSSEKTRTSSRVEE